MKSKFAKRLAALLLTLVMSLGLLVPGAFADTTVNKVEEKTGNNGSIVVTVYDQNPVEGPDGTGTGAQVTSGLDTPVDGVGINALRIGSVVELTSTGSNGVVSTQVAFGLSSDICTRLNLAITEAIASKEENSTITYYFEPAVVQDALKKVNDNETNTGKNQADIEDYLDIHNDWQKVTGADGTPGQATFSSLPYGLYLLAKSAMPADATTDLVPFLVSVPMYVEDEADSSQNAWQTTVYAYPKVRTAEITLTKTVDDNDSVGYDSSTDSGDIYVNAGQTLKYTVNVNIPAAEKGNNDPTEFEQFIITDTNDNQTLNLNMDSSFVLKLKVNDTVPIEETLTGISKDEYEKDVISYEQNAHYYYDYSDQISPSSNSVLTITFTAAGRKKLNENLSKTVPGTTTRLDQTLTITYNATVATDVATFSNTLVNTAELSYQREGMTALDDTKKDTVNLYTYGIDLTKTLSEVGVSIVDDKITFALYKDPDCTETNKISVGKNAVNNSYWVAASGLSDMSVKADKDDKTLGKLTLYGLEPGTYYLKETATMDGYALLDEPIEIKIEENNIETNPIRATATINGANVASTDGVFNLSVENTKLTAGFALPQTGGAGTLAVTAIGLGLLCVAIVLLVVYRKKGNKNS